MAIALSSFTRIGSARSESSLPRSGGLERKLGGIVGPGIENLRSAVGHVPYVSGGEVKVLLKRRGGQERVDDRGGVTGETLDLSVDGSPAESDLIGNGQNSRGESRFQRPDRLLQARPSSVSRRKVVGALFVLRNGQNAQEHRVLGLRTYPLRHARMGPAAA